MNDKARSEKARQGQQLHLSETDPGYGTNPYCCGVGLSFDEKVVEERKRNLLSNLGTSSSPLTCGVSINLDQRRLVDWLTRKVAELELSVEALLRMTAK